MERCLWARENDALLTAYHDNEYARKRKGDRALFEKLCLECFQAGLSWRTVLYKREALREVFYQFELDKVAAMTPADVQRLMQDKRIIRNRRKIEAVIHNAGITGGMVKSGVSLFEYFYAFKSGAALCADLKKRGFKFTGETICSAFLESVGAVEGHEKGCFLHGADLWL